jgi:hypothetical protein
MTPINMTVSPIGTAVACGAILSSLLDTLVEGDVLNSTQIRHILERAMTDLGPRASREGGRDAQRVVAGLLVRFSESNV